MAHRPLRSLLLAVMLGLWGCQARAEPPPGRADAPLILATISIHADIVAQIAGEAATVLALVGPDGDPHIFEPSPETVRHLRRAALVVANGGGLEPWLPRLIRSASYEGPVLQALPSPPPGGADPHLWQSVPDLMAFVLSEVDSLARALPNSAAAIRLQGETLQARLRALDDDIRRAWATVPAEQRLIVTNHDAFSRYGRTYGIRFLAATGLATESEAGAKSIARLTRQLRDTKAKAIFLENIASPQLMESLARSTGTTVGGRLYSDALSPPDGPASTYDAMMRFNTRQLITALGGRM